MRQLHNLFDLAKTWHVIVDLCFAPNLPELNPKLFCSDVQNNFRLSSGKFGAKHRNQQTITCQVLAELNKLWSCLIFIKLYRWQFQYHLDNIPFVFHKILPRMSFTFLIYQQSSIEKLFLQKSLLVRNLTNLMHIFESKGTFWLEDSEDELESDELFLCFFFFLFFLALSDSSSELDES